MTKLEKVRGLISAHKPTLAGKFKVKNLFLFGSYARGEAHSGSDMDILVDFSGSVGMFTFMELEEYLKRLLKVKKVDLVSRKALKPYIGKHILREAVKL